MREVHPRAELRHQPGCGVDDASDLVVDREGATQIDRDGDPQTGQGPVDRWRERLAGITKGLGCAGVRPGEHAEQQREVTDVAGHRSTGRGGLPLVVERPLGDPSQGGPHPHDSAERCRVAQRAPHVRPIREGHHAGCEGGRRSPARTACRAARVVRVASGAEDGVEGVRPGRELGCVGLADQHHARLADSFDDQFIGHRDVVAEDRRSVRRPPPRGRVRVLDREGQPVQRAEWAAPGEVLVGCGRADPCTVGVERHDRVELQVALSDPRQVQLEEFACRDPALAHGGRHRPRRGFG